MSTVMPPLHPFALMACTRTMLTSALFQFQPPKRVVKTHDHVYSIIIKHNKKKNIRHSGSKYVCPVEILAPF